MERYKCCRCKERLPREAFGGKTKRADYCRPCHNEVTVKYRAENIETVRATNRRAAAKRYAINREKWREYLLDHPCIDCGEKDIRVLDFDHREQSDKRAQIGDILGSWNWDTILTEIAKCDVRCANDHRRRTAEQFGWYGGGANDKEPESMD